MKILFICKKHEIYGVFDYCRKASGLFNSTSFIVRALQGRGIDAEIVEVNDNNDIDREVTRYRPEIVVLEALWVVPPKFDVLMPLHRSVKWFVHLHSQMPFLALEGNATAWIIDCALRGVRFIANAPEAYNALNSILTTEQMVYLPNVYMGDFKAPRRSDQNSSDIDIGCFGALRPLKNHLLQAMAAIKFARQLDKRLRFHVNATRIETGGQPVLKNLRQLFGRLPDAELVEQCWMNPDEFVNILSNIDMGLQVSLTETFNVVSADYTTAGIPIVVSKEVPWASRWNRASDADSDDIVRIMHRVYNNNMLVMLNQWLLSTYSRRAQGAWTHWVRNT